MTLLVPMRPEAFAAYRQSEAAAFAEENVSSGRWPEAGALDRSIAEFDELLPQGLDTPDHRLYEILAAAGGPVVGFLWVAVEERHGIRGAFVYEIEIKPEFRRQGHAKRALQALEAIVASLGLSRISLQLSGRNPGAQALYSKLGFVITGISMRKDLAA